MSDSLAAPSADDAEADLLCAVMWSGGECLDGIRLAPGEFFRPANEAIYSTARAMRTQGVPVGLTTLAARLLATLGKEGFEHIGGPAYLAALYGRHANAPSAPSYADIVREAASRRTVIREGFRLQHMGANPAEDLRTMVEAARSQVNSLADLISGSVEHDLEADLDAAIDAIQHGTTSMPTPWPDLDHFIGGWRRGAVYVVAGRPGGGKSLFGEQAAIHAMVEHGVPTALQSMEMGRTEIHQRAFSMLGEVNLGRIMRGGSTLGADEWGRLAVARGQMGETRFEVDDCSRPTVADVRATVARCKRRHGSCGLVVIDYLQLLGGAGRAENRQTEVAAISRDVKVLAKDLDVPVILLAQLNRGPEGEKRPPRPSDLRESGAVEQDADVVILLHRDAEKEPHVLHVGVGKNRHGPTGALKLQWQGHYSRLMPEEWTPTRVIEKGRAA